jgi:hypothetical protein
MFTAYMPVNFACIRHGRSARLPRCRCSNRRLAAYPFTEKLEFGLISRSRE